MASGSYKILSQEGADRYGREIGEVVDDDLTVEQERALVAAGWLEPAKKKDK